MSITSFYLPVNIVEGPGCVARIGEYLGSGKTVLVTDRGLAKTSIVASVLGAIKVCCADVMTYTDVDSDPDETMVMALVKFIRVNHIEQVVAVGGGSAIDTAKAAACLAPNDGPMEDYQWEGRQFESQPLSLTVIPTTAGTGSEVSGVAVIGSRNTKKGIKHPYVFAKTALIDPELTLSLPPFLTATTGIDALTHAIEAYIGVNDNPLIKSLAESAIRIIADSLPEAVINGSNLQARSGMAKAAMMAGIAMDLGGLGLVHSLSAPLCNNLHVAHGLGNAFLLPDCMEYNLIGNEETFARLSILMGGSGPNFCIQKVREWLPELGLTKPLSEVASKLKAREDIAWLAELGSKMFLMKNNPRPADAAACEKILRKAAEL